MASSVPEFLKISALTMGDEGKVLAHTPIGLLHVELEHAVTT